ncbi:MAG TPA: DUF4386 domain-containing protein [Gemmatimonadales bacterium]|nr:DUF4386 domain-containing protein [Gemmatimonadales bacterium]
MANGATSGEGTAAKLASIAQSAAQVRINVVLGLLTCFTALVLAVALYGITRGDQELAVLALACRVALVFEVALAFWLLIKGVATPATRGAFPETTWPFNVMYIPRRFIVPGDATATAANITGAELTYRIGIFSGLVADILFIYLVLTLYQLFKDVDRKQARLIVMLVLVGVTVGLVNLLNQIAPVILLSSADFPVGVHQAATGRSCDGLSQIAQQWK